MAIQSDLIDGNIKNFKLQLERELGSNSDFIIRDFQLHSDMPVIFINGI
ncbi:hypothetical protein [Priestia megaterium]